MSKSGFVARKSQCSERAFKPWWHWLTSIWYWTPRPPASFRLLCKLQIKLLRSDQEGKHTSSHVRPCGVQPGGVFRVGPSSPLRLLIGPSCFQQLRLLEHLGVCGGGVSTNRSQSEVSWFRDGKRGCQKLLSRGALQEFWVLTSFFFLDSRDFWSTNVWKSRGQPCAREDLALSEVQWSCWVWKLYSCAVGPDCQHGMFSSKHFFWRSGLHLLPSPFSPFLFPILQLARVHHRRVECICSTRNTKPSCHE